MNINDNVINKDSYATYAMLSSISMRCIEYLLENNELIWKLLKYNDADAWNKPNLTKEEKRAMIYDGSRIHGQDMYTKHRIFMDVGQDESLTEEITILQIEPYNLIPANRVRGQVNVIFQILSHYQINHMSNYNTRVDSIVCEIIKTLNGKSVNGIGVLALDNDISFFNKMQPTGVTPFRGKTLMMATHMN